LGPAAAAAVPALTQALDDPVGAVTFNAAEALGRIGMPAVPALVSRLENEHFRTLAASILGEMGPTAKDAVPALVRLLDVADRATATEALIALASIGPAAKDAVPVLLKKFADPNFELRPGAAYALTKIGATEAIPRLQQTVKTTDNERLRMACAWALVQFEPANEEYVRLALPGLEKTLFDEWSLVRKESASALARIGPRAKSAAPSLVKLLSDTDPQVRREALYALWRVDPDANTLTPLATKSLEDADLAVRTTAGYVLGELGPAAESAVPALRRLLLSPIEFEKTIAAWALVRIAPTPELIQTAVPLLVKALEHDRSTVRIEAAKMLGDIGGKSAPAKVALQQAAKDENEDVKAAATAALEKLAKGG
jgi:HEAT repeat protein